MVEYTSPIDSIFNALSDPVRRDILERAADGELTVNEIAVEYDMSLAAVSKHLKVLFEAGLIQRRKDGRFVYISTQSDNMREAADYLQQYGYMWNQEPSESVVKL